MAFFRMELSAVSNQHSAKTGFAFSVDIGSFINLLIHIKGRRGICLIITCKTFLFHLEVFPVPFVGNDRGHDLVGAGPDGRKPQVPEDPFNEKAIITTACGR